MTGSPSRFVQVDQFSQARSWRAAISRASSFSLLLNCCCRWEQTASISTSSAPILILLGPPGEAAPEWCHSWCCIPAGAGLESLACSARGFGLRVLLVWVVCGLSAWLPRVAVLPVHA